MLATDAGTWMDLSTVHGTPLCCNWCFRLLLLKPKSGIAATPSLSSTAGWQAQHVSRRTGLVVVAVVDDVLVDVDVDEEEVEVVVELVEVEVVEDEDVDVVVVVDVDVDELVVVAELLLVLEAVVVVISIVVVGAVVVVGSGVGSVGTIFSNASYSAFSLRLPSTALSEDSRQRKLVALKEMERHVASDVHLALHSSTSATLVCLPMRAPVIPEPAPRDS